jgi:hypothetical protein
MIDDFIRDYPEHAEEVQERASIMEHDGGMTKNQAEIFAVNRVKEKYNIYNQAELFGGSS